MMPGMSNIQGGFSAGGGRLRSTASGTGASPTMVINKPAGTVDGDLMIAVMSGGGVDPPVSITWTGDSGWTEVIDKGLGPHLRAAYKVASSEGASYTFTASGNNSAAGVILSFYGMTYDTVSASAYTSSGDGAYAIPGITVQGGYLMAVYGVNYGFPGPNTYTTPSGMDLIYNSSEYLLVAGQSVGGGATGSRTSTLGGGVVDAGGFLIAVKHT